jgi:PST family polysaccharide transporter
VEKVQRSFLTGALILSVAMMICRILGVMYRIPYQNITGNEGMYVYSQVYPLYNVLLVLATAGFPLAISKLVSERVALGDHTGAKQIYRVACMVLVAIGIVAFFFLYFGATFIASWMGNREQLTLPIQAVSFALLLIPFTAAMRGLFQGYQEMMPSAVSQVAEQLVRVITILTCAWLAISSGLGVVYAGAGALFGATTGALIAVIVLLWYRKKSKTFQQTVTMERQQTLKVLRALFVISLPICLNSLLYPLMGLVDSFTIANVLVHAQWNIADAIDIKGAYDRGGPLLQFAAFFATGIALSIVPAITEAQQQGRKEEVAERSNLALRITWMLGLPASFGLLLVAMPVNVMLFKDADGSDALAILALSTMFVTLSVTSAGILQGIGKVIVPAISIGLAVLAKAICNVILIPFWDIRGAAIATVFAYAVGAAVNLWLLRRQLSLFHMPSGKLIAANAMLIAAVVATRVALSWLIGDWENVRLAMTVTTLASVLVGVVAYLWAVGRFSLLSDKELAMVPKLQKLLGKL